MGQAVPDVAVEEADQGTVGQQGEQGPNVDRVEAPADQEGDHHDDDWWDEVDQLGDDHPVVAVEEAEDVGRVVVGVHDQVGPLVDRDGTTEGGDPEETEDGPEQEGQVRHAQPGEEGHEDVDKVAEAGDKADLAEEAEGIPLPDQELVGNGNQNPDAKHRQADGGTDQLGDVDLRGGPGTGPDIGGDGQPVAEGVHDQASDQGQDPD